MPTAARLKRKRDEDLKNNSKSCRRMLDFFARSTSNSPALSPVSTGLVIPIPRGSDDCTQAESNLSENVSSTPVSVPIQDIVTQGISTPSPVNVPLQAVASSRKRNNSGHRTSFNTEWQTNRPWLVCKEEWSEDSISYQAMYCTLCQKWNTTGGNGSSVWNKTGCVSLRPDSLKSHESSSMHLQAVSLELTGQRSVRQEIDSLTTKEFKALEDAQKVLFFLISNNLPHTTLFKPLIDLCVSLGATNLPYLDKAKNASYTSHRTVDEFLDCQAEVTKEKVENAVVASGKYGLMLDEYTDIQARKHLALVTRYIDMGEAKLAFLQDIQIPNGTADTIYTAVKGYITNSSLALSDMVSFASDGPSVMLGKKNGVVSKLKADNPSVITVHCMNHRLQLAVSRAFKSIPQVENVDEMLMGLFKYYHYSTVRTESLNTMQTLLREMGELDTDRNLTIKKAVHTRWLSHENAVQTVRKLYIPIVQDLENAVTSGRDKTLGDSSGIPAGSLRKMMLSYSKVYFLHLLCDVCSILASLTRMFEKVSVDLSIIEPKLQSTISNLKNLKQRPGPYLMKLSSVTDVLNLAPSDDVHAIRDSFIDRLVEEIEDNV